MSHDYHMTVTCLFVSSEVQSVVLSNIATLSAERPVNNDHNCNTCINLMFVLFLEHV